VHGSRSEKRANGSEVPVLVYLPTSGKPETRKRARSIGSGGGGEGLSSDL
jgi:hypothetical protein